MRVFNLLAVTIGPDGKVIPGGEGLIQSSIPSLISQVSNILIFLVGAASVIMIIVGGLHYVLSNGEPAKIAQAKNTLLYAVIGLIVALVASLIVRFVLGAIK